MDSGKLTIGTLVLLILTATAAIFRPAFLWGINSLGYLPIIQALAAIALSLIVYLILWKISSLQTSEMEQPTYTCRYINLAIIVLSAAALILLMYQFRSATYLLGDGFLRITETEAGMKFHFSEPLDKFIQHTIYETIGRKFELTSAQTHQTISIFGGILFYVFALWFLAKIQGSLMEKMIIGSLIFSSAMIQLFFGYVESYSISTPLLLFSIGLCFYEIKNNRPVIWGMLVFMFACLFHMSLLAYYPAFLILAVLNWKTKKRRADLWALISTAIMPAVPVALAIILNHLQFKGDFGKNIFEFLIMPVTPNNFGYWLLSPQHLIDMINQILLVAPAAVIILITCNPLSLIKKRNNFAIFLIIMSVCGLMFLLLFKTAFGIGRDWDLFSSIAIPLNILAGFLILKKLPKKKHPRPQYLFLPIIPALLIATGFILANSRADSSLKRYRDIIDLTEYGKNLNLENLGEYYAAKEDTAGYYSVLREATEISPHPRYYFKIAQRYLADGLTTEAIDNFYKALEVDSTYIPALNYLGMTYGSLGEKDPQFFDIAENFFNIVLKYDPEYSNAYYNLGNVYAHTLRYDDAIKSYRRSLELDGNFTSAYEAIAHTFMKTKAYDSAAYYYNVLLERDSSRLKGYLSLAGLYHDVNRMAKAEDILNKANNTFTDNRSKIEIAGKFALLGMYNNAINILTSIIAADECPLDGYITLANIYYILDRKTEGSKILSDANRLHNDPPALVAIAEAFLQLNAKDSAEMYLYKAIKKEPRFTSGYQKLSMFYLLQGENSQAQKILEMGLEHIKSPDDRRLLNSALEKIIQN